MSKSEVAMTTKEQLLERRNRIMGPKAPLFYDEPVHIVRGEGVWLYDADGNRYLDCYNNVPCVGHCHPKVVEALTAQASTLNVHTRYLHETVLEYGERLTATFDDSLSMVFMTCTGSEANDLALRMARRFTGGEGILCTNATYHGNTAAVDALATGFNRGQPNGPGVRAINVPDTYRPMNRLSGDALTDALIDQISEAIASLEKSGEGFAGMLVCPIYANEGLPDLPPRYLERAAETVRVAGGLVIFDEVQAGFGRSGKMWGHEWGGVVPDICSLGKPMGNGHPVAGVVCRDDIGNHFRDGIMYFNTFGGNPVSSAVALAVLDVIQEEGLVENALETGRYVRQGLEELASRYPVMDDVRGSGLFFGVEMISDASEKTPATAEAGRLANLMKLNGVLMSKIGIYDNVLKMRPPLCFDRDHADLLLETLSRCLEQL